MFQFLKKNSQRNNGYNNFYPSPYPNQYMNNYMPNQANPYDVSMMDTQINELKREINDLYQRVNRLEAVLGVRDNPTNVNPS